MVWQPGRSVQTSSFPSVIGKLLPNNDGQLLSTEYMASVNSRRSLKTTSAQLDLYSRLDSTTVRSITASYPL